MSGEGVRLMILSDTHGRLSEQVLRACEGAARIVHAGDVGADTILPELEEVAPVTVVSGNVDPYDLAPIRGWFEISGWRVYVQHIVWQRGGPSLEVKDFLSKEGADVVIFGHSHEPLCRQLGATVFFNPGSCGPKRFSLPRTYGEVVLNFQEGHFRIFDLEMPPDAPPLIEARFPRSEALKD